MSLPIVSTLTHAVAGAVHCHHTVAPPMEERGIDVRSGGAHVCIAPERDAIDEDVVWRCRERGGRERCEQQ